MIYDQTLLTELELLKADMVENEQDLVISIWGREGTGKSKVAANLAVYLDHTFTPEVVFERVAQTFTDYARVFPEVKPFQVGWWDEAHRFSKRGSLIPNQIGGFWNTCRTYAEPRRFISIAILKSKR